MAAERQDLAKPVLAEGLNLLPAVGGDEAVRQPGPHHHVHHEGDGEQGQDGDWGRVQANRRLGGAALIQFKPSYRYFLYKF